MLLEIILLVDDGLLHYFMRRAADLIVFRCFLVGEQSKVQDFRRMVVMGASFL